MAGTLASFRLPVVENEPNHHYEPGSKSRAALQLALQELQKDFPIEVPCMINGRAVKTGKFVDQINPADHKTVVARVHQADEKLIKEAIEGALEAKKSWENVPFNDRAAIFLKAADLISTKYRAKLCAATMLGQGKNAWQAEIDAAAEAIDFLRFGVSYCEQLYAIQPPKNSPSVWNRVEYRPLEGFVLAITPFNFLAIGVNLPAAPAMLGNVAVWKPSPMAVLSNYYAYMALQEAGLPAGVIQFVPAAPEPVCKIAFSHPLFAALHYTGSTAVFKKLWKDIAANIDNLVNYPRIVGETGGKNFHLLHSSADVRSAVLQTIRGAFEYSGQKCSACSRLYVPESIWPAFKESLLAEAKKVTVGDPTDPATFVGPVIARHSFDKITRLVGEAKKAGGEIIAGGTWDDSKGFFIDPTIIVTKDPKSVTMKEELFGPVLTIYVYKDTEWSATCKLIDETTTYALTGAIFSQDRAALIEASNLLRNSAGNVYYNQMSTGAVVGQQPFGGGRASGTNDKAGSINLLYRFVSMRSIKETFVQPETFVRRLALSLRQTFLTKAQTYPSNLP